MDAFHDQDVIVFEAHPSEAIGRAPALLEVEAGDFHFFAGEQLVDLEVQVFQVHGIQALEVEIAVLVARGLLPVYEVVVQFDDLRVESEDAALEGDTQGGGGLAAGGRAGDHDDAALGMAAVDLIGDGGVFPAVQGFGDVDDIDGFPVLDGPVEVADAVDADDVAPVGVFGQGRGDLGLAEHGHDFIDIRKGRELEAEAVAESGQVKGGQVAGRGDQGTVEGVFRPVQGIDAGGILAEAADQGGLVHLVLFLVDGDGLLGEDLGFGEGQVGVDDRLHPVFQLLDLLVLEVVEGMVPLDDLFGFLEFAVQAARKGVVDDEDLVREEVADGFLEDEAEGTDVAAASLGVAVADEFDFMGDDHPVAQFLELVVDEGGQYRAGRTGLGVTHLRAPFLRNLLKGRAEFGLVAFAVVCAPNL